MKLTGERSLSEALDQIVTQARAGAGAGGAETRSVVGHARIPSSDEALAEAGAVVAALFRGSIRRGGKPRTGPGRKGARSVASRRHRA